MNRIIIILLTFFSLASFGQNNTPTYTWRMHLPYNSVRQIIEVGEQLYVLADVGVYTFGLKSGEVEFLTKVDGFAESEVSCIAYSSEYKALVVAYKSGNIDILKRNEIINIPGVKRSSIVGIKEIYEIKTYKERAYMATSFGVVVLDLEKEEIIDDYQNLGFGGTSLSVASLGIYRDSLFIGTTEGLKVAPAYDINVNLKNFASWETRPAFDSAYLLQDHNDRLFFVNDSILREYSDGNYMLVDGGVKKGYKSIVSSHDELIITRWEGISAIDKSGVLNELGEPFMQYAITDYQENLWFGGFYRGLIKITPSGQASYVTPQGPFSQGSYDMEGKGAQMWVTSGGHTSAFGPTFSDRGYYMYEDGEWVNNEKSNQYTGVMLDFTNILSIPDKNEFWLGSFGSGLAHIINGVPVAHYDHTNSAINSAPGDRDVAFGMAMDRKENLWVANYETERALVVLREDGSWEDFNVGTKRLGEMVVDESDQVWMLLPRTSSNGILVVKEDDNGLLQRRFLGTNKTDGGLPNNNVNAIAVDKDNEIWVGTETGIAVFYNPSLVFDGGVNADAQQIIIDDGSDIGYLLGSEVVNDIKIDGGNRKWVATNNGAWLIAEDGSAVVLHLTSQNSPLPSDEINCIGIVPKTGEVFFGTKNGIASFRGDATEASDLHSNTLVFPNPVHSDYEGPITITGLAENATVKIADVAGRVVYELIATGGTAIWNGRNFNGDKPQTGVYLIFSANEEDEDALVSKLLLVR
ncbi:hypothetical protein OAD66_01150 [Bacteroidia bacterium]|nr:hypothetical protein [Bacteroidia bacterium]MDB9881733.1 hypothetical protein [Bacteroidia bacterium]